MAFLDSDSHFARFDSINQPPACRDDGAAALLPPAVSTLAQHDAVLASPTTRVLRSTKQRLVDDAERTRKRLQEFGALLSRDKENATSPASAASAISDAPSVSNTSASDLTALRTQFDQLLAHYRLLGTTDHHHQQQDNTTPSQRQEIELVFVHMAQVLARLGFSPEATGPCATASSEAVSVSQDASLADYAPLLRTLALLLAQQQQQQQQQLSPQPHQPQVQPL